MTTKRLLDSSVVVDLFRGDKAVAERIAQVDVAISLIALGELRFGVSNAGQREMTLEQLEAFIKDCEIITLTERTSVLYGELKAGQLRIGKEIPHNDTWIAASAKEHGLVLAHRDKHFPMIPDFDHERW